VIIKAAVNEILLIDWLVYRKPPTNVITQCCSPRPDRDSNSQHQW